MANRGSNTGMSWPLVLSYIKQRKTFDKLSHLTCKSEKVKFGEQINDKAVLLLSIPKNLVK